MLVLLQAVTVANHVSNITVLLPRLAPKFVPVIVMVAVKAAGSGETLVITGGTVNATALLATPLAVSTSEPEVAVAGIMTRTLVSAQEVTVSVVLLILTVLLPCVAPKSVPAMVTLAFALAEPGVTDVIAGGDVTPNVVPALCTPFTVTTTGPVVAPLGTRATIRVLLQLEMVVGITPLNVIVLVP
jgi:hypothetical protein